MYPGEYRYSKEHEWVKVEGDRATIGITDHAQKELGDVVYVELPAVGKKIQASVPLGSVESVKAVSDIFAPVSGEVTAINQAVIDTPETINKDPHGAAWLVQVRLDEPAQVDALMDADAYQAFIAGKSH